MHISMFFLANKHLPPCAASRRAPVRPSHPVPWVPWPCLAGDEPCPDKISQVDPSLVRPLGTVHAPVRLVKRVNSVTKFVAEFTSFIIIIIITIIIIIVVIIISSISMHINMVLGDLSQKHLRPVLVFVSSQQLQVAMIYN